MKVVSLFSGVGGLDMGFIKTGHQVVWANDVDKDAVATYKLNIGEQIIQEDIRKIPSSTIPDCDIVAGGFPCQGFSVANIKRNETDSRNFLYLELLRVIRDKRPKFFLAENVKGILSLGKGKIISLIMQDFNEAGYIAKYKVLNAADYGVPQRRERVIFLGVRKDLAINLSYPLPSHCDPEKLTTGFLDNDIKPWVTIGEALKDIPEPDEKSDIPNHTYSKYKLRFNGYLGHRTIDPNKPSPTVTGRGDDKGGVVVLHHPKNHRRMSARELAIVQSFPMNFVFVGTRSTAYRLIANAVPPVLAEALGRIFPLE